MRGQYSDCTIFCDVSTSHPCSLTLNPFCSKTSNIIHGLSHSSGQSPESLMKHKFIWHRMNKDVGLWAQCCVVCQTSKISCHTELGTGEFPQPKRHFGYLYVNVVGPLPPSDSAQYLFATTESSTCWPEAITMKHATAQDCARALLHGWISCF